MAQSRVNQLDLASLLAAKKNTGTADAINSAVQGVSTGLSLAESLQAKRLAQQKAQADMAARVQELQNKAQDLANDKQKIDQNSVPVQVPAVAATAKLNAPITQFKPQEGPGLPSSDGTEQPLSPVPFKTVSSGPTTTVPTAPYASTTTKNFSPEAAKAMNPDIDALYKQAAAEQATKGTPIPKELQGAYDLYVGSKVPESFTTIAEKAPTETAPGAALVAGSKKSGTRQIVLPSDFHTSLELSGNRGEAMMERNRLAAADKIRTELNPSHFTDPTAKLAALKAAAADRFDAILAQLRSQNGGPTTAQTVETARQLDNMLTNSGQSSEGITQALIPHTLLGKAKNFEQFVTNVPTGLGQQAFLEQTADTFNRERQVAHNQIKQYMKERIGGLGEARRIAPDVFNSQLLSVGLDPKYVDDNGVYNEPPPAASPVHNEALDWANAQLKANPNDPKALAVKAKAEKELGNGIQPR